MSCFITCLPVRKERPPVSGTTALGYRHVQLCLDLYISAGDTNSHPHTCAASLQKYSEKSTEKAAQVNLYTKALTGKRAHRTHTQKAVIANHCHYHYPKKLKTAFCNNDSKTNNDSSVQKLAIKEALRGTEGLTDVREALERDICILNRLGVQMCLCIWTSLHKAKPVSRNSVKPSNPDSPCPKWVMGRKIMWERYTEASKAERIVPTTFKVPGYGFQ